MRFDAKLGDTGEVYDANGILLPYAIRGDTDSGLVESMTPGTNTVVQRHPAPLYIKNFNRGARRLPTGNLKQKGE